MLHNQERNQMPDRVWTKRAKSIACRRCHARKVKCSGGVPCSNCHQADKAAECIYPRKARLVRVSERYIEDLVAENQRLRRSSPESSNEECNSTGAAKDPALSETPWFVNADALHTPILVADASDSAFATQFRQALSNGHAGHLPRVNFPSDEQLLTLSDAGFSWPTPARARLLVQAALNGLGRCYHIVRRSSILQDLEQAMKNNSRTRMVNESKLLAVFAIGELYTTRTSNLEKGFPGIHYFCKATNILRVVSERPSVDMVEIKLLLSMYSLFLNRRHAAYSLAGSAVRLAVIMGLHLNIPESQLSDVCEREHRNRIWWTAYTFDRMWAAKLGYPTAIRDDEIEVNLPSNPVGLSDNVKLDFPDREYFVARVGLARLSGRVIYSIYGQRKHEPSLSRRIQSAFKDLRQWLEGLPPFLRVDRQDEDELDPRARSLHLLFNQLTITATRPILLHVLRVHLEAREQQPSVEANVPASASTLSETCIRCARHSCRLLIDSWTNGTFMTFDFFYTQYLFSAATVLGISTLLDSKERQSDEEQFEVAASLFPQLRDCGNYAAAEFYQHIEAATVLMQKSVHHLYDHIGDFPTSQNSTNTGNTHDFEGPSFTLRGSMTAGTALSEPLLHELLDQPLPDLQFIDSSISLDERRGFSWPSMSPEGGAFI